MLPFILFAAVAGYVLLNKEDKSSGGTGGGNGSIDAWKNAGGVQPICVTNVDAYLKDPTIPEVAKNQLRGALATGDPVILETWAKSIEQAGYKDLAFCVRTFKRGG